MSPATHLLISWAAADAVPLDPRDRKLVTWCGVLPDLDGLGVLADLANELLGRPETYYYPSYHHFLSHGLPAAVLLPVLLGLCGRSKVRVWIWGLVVVHLHLLCDLAGSRGPAPTDLWPIYYLAPLSRSPMVVWAHQWPLNGWPNFLITIGAMAWAAGRTVRTGRSPFSLASQAFDEKAVQALRGRAAKLAWLLRGKPKRSSQESCS